MCRLWPWEKSSKAAAEPDARPAGYVYCCKGNLGTSHAYVRAAWERVGIQHVGDGGPDCELFTCPRCGTTLGIDIECPGGQGHALLEDSAPSVGTVYDKKGSGARSYVVTFEQFVDGAWQPATLTCVAMFSGEAISICAATMRNRCVETRNWGAR